jgi:hypothetical protein
LIYQGFFFYTNEVGGVYERRITSEM